MAVKSHKAAVVIVPKVTDEFLDTIQNIRRKHDKAFQRWMPHINMLYPFYERESDNFKKDVKAIKHVMLECGVTKFRMKFNKQSVAFFEHAANANMHIKPLPVNSVNLEANSEATSTSTVKVVTTSAPKDTKAKHSQLKDLPLGYIDPFSKVHSDTIESCPSLYDLHTAIDKANATNRANINSTDASFAKFWDKSYAFWDIESSKSRKRLQADVSTPPQTKSNNQDEQIYTREDLEFLGNYSRDENLENIKKMPSMQRLQASLVRAFPECDDLNQISHFGFQPHLTLGQFKKMNLLKHVNEITEALFEEEEEEEFEVDQVLIITRKSGDDPFEVRASVELP